MNRGVDEVRSILGEPAVVTNWDTQAPPRDASAVQLAEFRKTALDTIWVYAGVVISFNVAGVAKLVTSDSSKYVGEQADPERRSTDEPKNLPLFSGSAKPQDWQSLDAIPARRPGPEGIRDLGVILFVHDDATKRVDFASRSDADYWQAVHTVSDMIEALRQHVGDDACVRGIMTSSHGGWSGEGGFRMGDINVPDDFVSGKNQAQDFGRIVHHALSKESDAFIAIESCYSAAHKEEFILPLHNETDVIVNGAVAEANVGGYDVDKAWWVAIKGRTQINRNGTTTSDSSTEGTDVWRPF
jgi:hypothetical protein